MQRENTMSAVVEFPMNRRRPAARTETSASAEVIIFPGVQIERLAFDLAERLPAIRIGSTAKMRANELDFY